jgi:hypothetical protein
MSLKCKVVRSVAYRYAAQIGMKWRLGFRGDGAAVHRKSPKEISIAPSISKRECGPGSSDLAPHSGPTLTLTFSCRKSSGWPR